MKRVLVSSCRFLVFAIFFAGFCFYASAYPGGNFLVAKDDSVSKKGIPLTGAQEVPAVSPSGSGSLDVSYDKSTKTLTYKATWTGMTDSVTMMHFHGPAEEGTNAGV